MCTKQVGLCMIVTSVIGISILAVFELALLAALTASVQIGDHALIIIFSACSLFFACACYISARILASEVDDYKRIVHKVGCTIFTNYRAPFENKGSLQV